MMGAFGRGPMGGASDRNPATTHVYELIQRPDVQNEIGMDLRQKNALTQYQGQVPGMIRQQMQQQMQNFGRGAGGRRGQQPGGGDPGAGAVGAGAAQQDPQAQREQMQQQFQQMQSELQTKIGQGLTEILKPEQITRLHQLDLQWRGVLSISDSTVAQEVQATPEQRTAIGGFLQEYQGRTQEARRQLMETMRAERQAAAAGNNQPSGGIRQDPMVQLERAETAARKEIEEKALKTLTGETRERWTRAQGRVFTFRSDIKTPQRF
jgi:hypothetical protein